MININLFIVGVPRSGTTSLYEYLKPHPQIFLPEIKEPHHFCRDLHKESDNFCGFKKHFPYRTEDSYKKLFKNVKNEPIIGEASTTYMVSTVAAQEIHNYNPDAKIVVLLRNPIEMIYSYYYLLKSYMEENASTFEEALSLEAKRKTSNASISQHTRNPSRLFYREIATFDKQLTRYLEVFQKKQVKIIVFDDFKENTEHVYGDLLKFLEVDDSFKPSFRSHYSYNEARSLRIQKLYEKHQESLRKKTPEWTTSIVDKIYWGFCVKRGSKPAMRPDTRKALTKDLLPSVKNLEHILNRDLVSLWNFQ